MGMSRITVYVDLLVLKGLEGDRMALVEEFQKEFAQLLANRATRPKWVRSYRIPVLRLGRLSLPGPSGDRKFGSKIARAIGKGLKP